MLFTWYFAATLFLIFAGMLLGVALNAMSNLLGRVVRLPHALRLTIVCLAVAGMLSGIIFLGGTTIAQQTTVLSNTLKSQLVNVKGFLERNGIDTSLFDFGSLSSQSDTSAPAAPTVPPTHSLPSAGTIASSGGAIFSQSLKLILGTASAVGNFFIVLFLGIAFATQPAVYRNGLLFMAPARHRPRVAVIIDRISETLERWLIAQIITMAAVFLVTWIGLEDHRHPECVHPGHPGRTARLHPDGRRHPRRTDRGAGQPRLRMGRGPLRFRPVPRRARAGELRADTDSSSGRRSIFRLPRCLRSRSCLASSSASGGWRWRFR